MCSITNNFKKPLLIILTVFISTIAFSQSLNDDQIKKNVTAINEPLQKLLLLEPKSFDYDTQGYKHLKLQSGRQYGFLAENVQTVFPDLVKEKSVSYMFGKNTYRDTKIKTIDEASLIPVLVASIKEQQKEIEKLKNAIEELKNKKGIAAN